MNHIGQQFNSPQDTIRSLNTKKIIDTEEPTPADAIDDSEFVNPR